MRNVVILFMFSALTLVSCSSFVEKEKIPVLKDYEKYEYILKKEVSIGNRTLARGDNIRLHIVVGDEWIKVYGYNAGSDPLQAQRLLILYLFEDDFTEERFSMEFFDKKLSELVKRKK